jgi:thioredoxin 1
VSSAPTAQKEVFMKTCVMMNNLRQNVSKIPRDVTIVPVNYDTQTALKLKFGITSQHAFVQINPQGKQIAIWAGSSTVDEIPMHIVRGGM